MLRDTRLRSGILLLCFAPFLLASDVMASGGPPPPEATAAFLPDGVERPVLDGKLDDAAWELATPIGPLIQVEPVEGAKPSQRTVTRVVFDHDTLYIGVRAFDTDPELLIAKVMRRDQVQDSDDRIVLVFDTFHEHRNGYLFVTNPNSARFDGIIEQNTRFRATWNGIWNARATVDEHGWSAEFAIPFETLSFDPHKDTWGFNMRRTVRRENEENRWSQAVQNKSIIDVSHIGTLRGLTGMEQGLGLDVIPSTAVRFRHDRPDDRSTTKIDPSLDVFYKLNPEVTAALTINTDFSDAEVDARQVNLDRFALFFPETRDFFLQDAGIFDFGVLRNPNGQPFFSRRIGIGEDGESVGLRAGVKATGRVERFNFGVLDTQMAAYGDVHSQNLAVARGKWNVGEESNVGFIGTYGNPVGNESNGVYGVDGLYRTSNILDEQVLEASAWFLRSETSGASNRQEAFGAGLRYPNDRWNGTLAFKQIGENYLPELGFVNRPGIREYVGDLRHRWRPTDSFIRTIDVRLDSLLVTDTSDHLETLRFVPTLVDVRNQHGDFVAIRGVTRTERLSESFEIADGVVLDDGRYDWGRGLIQIGTAISRPVSVNVTWSDGTFFSGTLRSLDTLIQWRPSRHFFTSVRYLQNQARLDEGSFTTRLVQWRAIVAFTPDLSWSTFLQWDKASEDLGWNSRLLWIVTPGSDIVFVWNQGISTENHDLRATTAEWTAKVSWTFRF